MSAILPGTEVDPPILTELDKPYVSGRFAYVQLTYRCAAHTALCCMPACSTDACFMLFLVLFLVNW